MKITLLAFSLFICSFVYAQSGSLDPTFSGDGKMTTSVGVTTDFGMSLAVQNDGKIILAGSSNSGSNTDFSFVRYNADGTVDITITTSIGFFDDLGNSVVIQPDGKILIAGRSTYDYAIARYNPNGTLDTTFDSDGIVITDFSGGADEIKSVTLQLDGKIVAAGIVDNGFDDDFGLARYNPNGSLDTTFSSDGKVSTDLGTGTDEQGFSVAIQPDGKILVGGQTYGVGIGDFVLARYNANGSLDNSFDLDGVVTTDFSGMQNRGYSMALQADGKIVLAGYLFNGVTSDYALARYNSNGSLDNSFDVDGMVVTDFVNTDDVCYAVTVQADAKILCVGYSIIGGSADFSLVRYNSDGSLDTTFGGDGRVSTDWGPNDRAQAVCMQPDGKIIVGGEAFFGSSYDYAIARYISGMQLGVLDFSIDNSSVLIYPNPITENTKLDYTLQTCETVTIEIYDYHGRNIGTLLSGQVQNAGNYSQDLLLMDCIEAGNYILVISTPHGKVSVKIVK